MTNSTYFVSSATTSPTLREPAASTLAAPPSPAVPSAGTVATTVDAAKDQMAEAAKRYGKAQHRVVITRYAVK